MFSPVAFSSISNASRFEPYFAYQRGAIDGVEYKLLDFVWMVPPDVSPDGHIRFFPSALVGKASHINFTVAVGRWAQYWYVSFTY